MSSLLVAALEEEVIPEEIKDLIEKMESYVGAPEYPNELLIEAFHRGQMAQDKVWKDALDKWTAGK